MKKLLVALLLGFVVVFAANTLFTTVQAANCFYRCICSRPNKCCTNNGLTTCKPDPTSPLRCPQIAC